MRRESALGSLAWVVSRLPCSSERVSRLLASVGHGSEPAPVRKSATAAHVPVELGRLPPFETITVGESGASERRGRSHGITVWNAGPKRELTVCVESAGRGHLLTTDETLHPDRPLRLELAPVDEYTVAVGTDRALLSEFTVAPEWFDRDASVTDVVVDDAGTVRYHTLAVRGDPEA
ncbi:hypothetical protein [Halorientalis halophila]|uniref:hypothetical protein n=1 Tax=Halorientalis halophila TaxID=3108499 RepID=UPI00300B2DB8